MHRTDFLIGWSGVLAFSGFNSGLFDLAGSVGTVGGGTDGFDGSGDFGGVSCLEGGVSCLEGGASVLEGGDSGFDDF